MKVYRSFTNTNGLTTEFLTDGAKRQFNLRSGNELIIQTLEEILPLLNIPTYIVTEINTLFDGSFKIISRDKISNKKYNLVKIENGEIYINLNQLV